MKRRHRLQGPGRVHTVRESGVEVRRDGVRVRACFNAEGGSRAALGVVGARGAVQRNRLRRRLRAALEPLLSASPGLDLIVTATPATESMNLNQLGVELEGALRTAVGRLQRREENAPATAERGPVGDNEANSPAGTTLAAGPI